jgi:hypothetical protein
VQMLSMLTSSDRGYGQRLLTSLSSHVPVGLIV